MHGGECRMSGDVVAWLLSKAEYSLEMVKGSLIRPQRPMVTESGAFNTYDQTP